MPVDPALRKSVHTQRAVYAPRSVEEDRRAARQMIGALFIAAGLAHLVHRRLYRSLVPEWLTSVRREVDVATGGLELVGGALLFVPRLRRAARWVGLGLLAPAVPAAVAETRRPSPPRYFEQSAVPGLTPVGARGRAPGHAGLAAALWWATAEDRPNGYGKANGPTTTR